jgi:hypothetical protein
LEVRVCPHYNDVIASVAKRKQKASWIPFTLGAIEIFTKKRSHLLAKAVKDRVQV